MIEPSLSVCEYDLLQALDFPASVAIVSGPHTRDVVRARPKSFRAIFIALQST